MIIVFSAAKLIDDLAVCIAAVVYLQSFTVPASVDTDQHSVLAL